MFPSLNLEAIGIQEKSLERKAELASLGGFHGIHLSLMEIRDNGVEKLVSTLKKYQLKISGSFLPFELGLNEKDFSRKLNDLRDLLRIASEAGCTRISTWIPPFSDTLPYRKSFELYSSRIRTVCKVLAEYDCRLGLEFIGTLTVRKGHRFTFVHTLGETLKLCDSVDEDNVGILLDSWHWYTSHGTFGDIESLEKDEIVDVHVNDAPAGVSVEEQMDNRRRLPGETGVIDCKGFLTALSKIRYEGPVMVEPFYDRLKEMKPRDVLSLVSSSLRAVWP
ncbi:MAG: sugar phosphate isomerase/epimerase family protein [Thermoproteota archaeon]